MAATPRPADGRTQVKAFVIEPEREQPAGQLRYRCAGELDLATAPVLSATLEHLDTDVILDFAGVSFLDSTGMSVLAVQRLRLLELGCTLRVEGLQDPPRRALQITGLLEAPTGPGAD